MPNLNIGDVVYFRGEKRKITYVRHIFGGVFLHLAGHAYMIRRSQVKPVIRVSAEIGRKWHSFREFPIHIDWG